MNKLDAELARLIAQDLVTSRQCNKLFVPKKKALVTTLLEVLRSNAEGPSFVPMKSPFTGQTAHYYAMPEVIRYFGGKGELAHVDEVPESQRRPSRKRHGCTWHKTRSQQARNRERALVREHIQEVAKAAPRASAAQAPARPKKNGVLVDAATHLAALQWAVHLAGCWRGAQDGPRARRNFELRLQAARKALRALRQPHK